MARRKQAALAVPETNEEAIALLGRYAGAERVALVRCLVDEDRIAEIKRSRDAYVAQIEAEQKVRFAALKAWWEAGGKDLAGKARSHELAGVKLGIRLSPPKVKLPRGTKEAAVIVWLGKLAWSRAKEFLRPKVELDKPAIIKAFQGEGDEEAKAQLSAGGISVVQADEFFIDAGLDETAIAKELQQEKEA